MPCYSKLYCFLCGFFPYSCSPLKLPALLFYTLSSIIYDKMSNKTRSFLNPGHCRYVRKTSVFPQIQIRTWDRANFLDVTEALVDLKFNFTLQYEVLYTQRSFTNSQQLRGLCMLIGGSRHSLHDKPCWFQTHCASWCA